MSLFSADQITVLAEQKPGQVSFSNFEDIKSYIEQGLSVYKTTEYTLDNFDQAKSDLKELKAIKKKLTDKQKELQLAYSLPFEEVNKMLNELIDMVKEPYDVIDKFIKNAEKDAKKQEILKYAEYKTSVLGEYALKVIESKAFFNDRWLNVSYKTKDWHADIDKIVQDTADAIQTIQAVGGKNKSVLLAYYFDKLSMDGAEQFLENVSAEISDVDVTVENENNVIGYKVLKVYGTERQMLQLMNQLELSDMDVEELEDGMPKAMVEITNPTFDTFVAFDIEHTGTFGIDNGDVEAEIIEIGAVKVVDGEIVDKFDMLANPGRIIVPQVSRLTHITDEMVQNEPSVDEVIKKFKDFAGNEILVGHNIKGCDIPHITRAAKRAGVSFENEFLDTKLLAKKHKDKMGWDSVKLQYLSEYFNISQTEAHRAWCDAEANVHVYFELKKI